MELSNKFFYASVLVGLFYSVMSQAPEISTGKVVTVNGKDFGDFNVLDVRVSKENGESESKKVVIVNIDNLKLTVDSTRGGVWVYLKSQTNNGYYNSVPSISANPSSEKIHTLDTRTLSPFDTLIINLAADVTSLESKKKIEVFINDMFVGLDTRNHMVTLYMKNGQNFFFNSNSVINSWSEGTDIDVEYHWEGSGITYSSSGGGGHFDQEAFDRGMNQLHESLQTMQANMQNNFPWNWGWN